MYIRIICRRLRRVVRNAGVSSSALTVWSHEPLSYVTITRFFYGFVKYGILQCEPVLPEIHEDIRCGVCKRLAHDESRLLLGEDTGKRGSYIPLARRGSRLGAYLDAPREASLCTLFLQVSSSRIYSTLARPIDIG